ncbi:MAG: A24 family peptidase [Candidatus Poribacteria bacterium]|nr:A24 family peptidase [Candidatus Poribacteria bacterium]
MNFSVFEFLTHERMVFLAVLSCGLYTGYTDFRYGKIANIYTLFLIGFGLISQVLFISEGDITWLHSGITILGGLGLAFAMFYTGIWAAGDAKLFWGISLLLPPSAFSQTSETQFHPLILLVNIFILFLVYVTLTSFFKTTFQQQKTLVSSSFVGHLKRFPRRLLQVLSYIGVGGLAFYIPSRLGVELDLAIRITLFMAIVFAFNKGVEKHIPQKYEIAFHLPFLLLAIFLAIPSLMQFGTFVVFIFFIPWFLLMFSSFIHSLFTKEIPIANLRPNMIPAERVVRIEQRGNPADKYMKVAAGFANPAQENVVVDVSSEGLTSEQIARLQQLAAKGDLSEFENKLLVQEKIPFAFMIVIGALMTLLAKGMVYSLVRTLELSQILEKVRLLLS